MTRRRFGASLDAPGKSHRHTENDAFRPNGPNATRSPGRSNCRRTHETTSPDGTGEPSRTGAHSRRDEFCESPSGPRAILFSSLRSSHHGLFAVAQWGNTHSQNPTIHPWLQIT